jgi:hypothetical protein
MKITDLKALIKEMAVDEMARIATGYKLADNWEEALSKLPDNIKKSSRIERIINYLKGKDVAYMRDAAVDIYNNPDTASVNQQFRTLMQAGVINQTGLASTPAYMNKPESTGILGRPKISDDSKKMIGAKVAAKYARGAADFTDEEVAYIKDLYKSISKK